MVRMEDINGKRFDHGPARKIREGLTKEDGRTRHLATDEALMKHG
jgi:hypothetical protein